MKWSRSLAWLKAMTSGPAAEQAGREPRHRRCEFGEGTGLERAVADIDQRGRLAVPGERVHPGGNDRTGGTGVSLSG